MAEVKTEDGTNRRAFICQTLNPFGFPAKDRSGRLDMVEEPHLGRLMAKIRGSSRQQLDFSGRLPGSTPSHTASNDQTKE